jgi:hypothetical protein
LDHNQNTRGHTGAGTTTGGMQQRSGTTGTGPNTNTSNSEYNSSTGNAGLITPGKTHTRSGSTSGANTTATPNSPMIPAESSDRNTESEKHDTTIHRTIKPAVIHETIRPIEQNIVTINLTVHRHVHHNVHRIQPVLVSSDEEERYIHDFMGQGMEPTHVGSYRELGNTNYSQGLEHELKDFDGQQCTVCDGATGDVIGGHEGRKGDVSGENCPIRGGDIDNKLTKDGHSHNAGHQAGQTGNRDLGASGSDVRDDGREFGTRHLSGTESGQRNAATTVTGSRDVNSNLSRGVQNINISRN